MFYSTAYQLLNIVLPLITIPYVSRVLGPQGIGINAYTGSFVSYFVLLANLGIQLYGNREIAYYQKISTERSKIFFELVFLKWIAGLISIGGYGVFVLFQGQWQLFYLLQGINILAVMFDISWYFMGMENFRIIVLRNTVVKIIIIVATFLLIKRPEDLWIYIFLLALSTLLGNISVWPFLRKEIVKVKLRELKILHHLRPALLLFLPQIIIQVYLSLNKSMLGAMDSVKSAGFFTQSDSIIRVAYTLTSSFGAAFLPRLSSMVSENKTQEVKSLTLKSFDLSNALGFLVVSSVMGVSGTFAVYFFGKDYYSVGLLMFVESLAILFISWGGVFGTQYLLAMKRMNVYAMSAGIGLITNVIANVILIPWLGALGAVIATVLTELAVSLYQIWSVREVFLYREVFGNLWKYILSGTASFVCIYLLNQLMSVGTLQFLIQIIAGFVIYSVLLIILKASVISLIKSVMHNFTLYTKR